MFRFLISLCVLLWMLAGGATSLAQGCGDAPAPRLALGGQGRVAFSDGQPLNIRDAASVSAGRIGSLPEGSAFAVLEGPVCADSIYWWRVQAADLTGWAAEGQAGAYFVEPLAGPGVVQPVSEDPPLLLVASTGNSSYFDQQLYRLTEGGWEALTSGGYKGGFALSPLGDRVVYLVAPPAVQEADAQNRSVLLGSVWDVAVLDLTDGSQRVLAAQPGNDQPGLGINRELPVWSPDGSAIAWTEQDYPARDAARLVVYDFTTESLRVLDEALPFMTLSSDGLPAFFAWGGPGIAVFTNDPPDYAEAVRLYDPAGGLRRVVRVVDEAVGAWLPLAGPVWVTAGDRETLVMQADKSIWLGVNADGSVSGWARQLVGASATGVEPGLQIGWDIFAGTDRAAWQLLDSTGAVLVESQIAPRLTRFAFAPSGQAAVFWQEDDTLTVWQGGESTVLDLPEDLRPHALLWGALRWSAGEEVESLG